MSVDWKKKMKRIYLTEIFKSNYCKVIFILSLILITVLIPKKIFYSYYSILGALFIFVTSITITCFIRNIKEKVFLAKANGASIIGIITIILGFGGLQACTVGAPVCGASIGAGFFALFFPGIAMDLIEKYSILVIILSIIIQIFALYFMNCFKKCKEVLKK